MYFLLQSCSGHSSNTGDTAHGDAVLHFFVEICTFNPVTGFTRLCVPDALMPAALLPERDAPPFPLIGLGLSSLDLRFSGRGGKNAVGDGDGVEFVVLLDALAVLVAVDDDDVFVVDVDAPVADARPPRAFEPPFRNLLCTELRVSVKLLKSFEGCIDAFLHAARFARPFGVRASNSSVGESQSLQRRKSLVFKFFKINFKKLPWWSPIMSGTV